MEKFKENSEYKVGEQVALEVAKTLEEQFVEALQSYKNNNERAAAAFIKDSEAKERFMGKGERFFKRGLSYEFAIVIAGFSDSDRALLEDGNHPGRYEAMSASEKSYVEKLRKKLKKSLGEAARRFKLSEDELYQVPWEIKTKGEKEMESGKQNNSPAKHPASFGNPRTPDA